MNSPRSFVRSHPFNVSHNLADQVGRRFKSPLHLPPRRRSFQQGLSPQEVFDHFRWLGLAVEITLFIRLNMQEITITANIESSAIKSPCGRYRYVLKRVWNPTTGIGAFLCANPSKADHLLYDETVYKCSNLAVQWGWGGIYILNLYPLYETDPKKLVHDTETDMINAEHVTKILNEVQTVIIATGNGHQHRLEQILIGIDVEKLYCLKKNKGNGYLHPSRIKTEDFKKPLKA